MRMKFKKTGHLLLVAAASLGVASLLSACNQLTGTLTIDFVYVTSAKAAGPNSYGEVDVFEVNSQSGHMRQIPTSPFPSGGRNPVAEAVSSDHNSLYVVNRDDNTIVDFTIGNDGKIYPQQTVNTPGIFPVATAVSGSMLFVADTYQPLPTCSPAAPCTGSVAAYPIATSGASCKTPGGSNANPGNLCSPAGNSAIDASYWPLTLPASPTDVVNPVAVVASGSTLFVAARDATTGTGLVYAFSTAGNALTPLNGGVPVPAGVQPSAIALDPSGTYLYVTDYAAGNILGWSVASGVLTPLSGSPFPAGNQPSALVIDATGKFAFVTDAGDSNVTGYGLNSGNLVRLQTYATDTQPVAVGIDPAANQYLYTVNFLSNTVSGFSMNASTGALLNSQNSPFTANANPTAVAAIPHGTASK
ncbi:lactonase family protein [Acidobacteria bacterium AB60]|nr:lactonase family protein [Acidobacteria bacterium AB60]